MPGQKAAEPGTTKAGFREIAALIANGMTPAEACSTFQIEESTYYQWWRELLTQRLDNRRKENARVKREGTKSNIGKRMLDAILIETRNDPQFKEKWRT